MKKIIALIASLAIVATVLSSCANPVTSVIKTIANGNSTANSGDNETTKYNAYIDLENLYMGNYDHDLNSYVKDEGFEKGKMTKDSTPSFSLSAYDKKTCQAALDASPKAPAKGDIDTTAADLATKMNTAIDTIILMDTYYSTAAYEADSYAQGLKYHDQLIDQDTAVTAAYKTFKKAFQPWADDSHKKELAQYKKEGKTVQYDSLIFYDLVYNLTDTFDNANLDTDSMTKMDYSKISDNIKLLTDTYTDLKAQLPKAEAQGMGAAYDTLADTDIDNIMKDVNLIEGSVKNKKPQDFSQYYDYSMQDGSIESLLDHADKLLQDYNNAVNS